MGRGGTEPSSQGAGSSARAGERLLMDDPEGAGLSAVSRAAPQQMSGGSAGEAGRLPGGGSGGDAGGLAGGGSGSSASERFPRRLLDDPEGAGLPGVSRAAPHQVAGDSAGEAGGLPGGDRGGEAGGPARGGSGSGSSASERFLRRLLDDPEGVDLPNYHAEYGDRSNYHSEETEYEESPSYLMGHTVPGFLPLYGLHASMESNMENYPPTRMEQQQHQHQQQLPVEEPDREQQVPQLVFVAVLGESQRMRGQKRKRSKHLSTRLRL